MASASATSNKVSLDLMFHTDTRTAELTAHLDTLLARYLALLDRHERLREFAQQHFRAGHLALAEANFHSTNKVARYGQDYYDEKMTATLRIDILAVDVEETDEKSDEPKKMAPWTIRGRLLPTRGMAKNQSKKGCEAEITCVCKKDSEFQNGVRLHQSQLPTPPGSRDATPATTQTEDSGMLRRNRNLSPRTIDTDRESRGAKNVPIEGQHRDVEHQDALPPDPLRQFGVLLPSALRSAQTSFRRSLLDIEDDNCSNKAIGWIEVAVLGAEMRAVEIEVQRTRKKLKKLSEVATSNSSVSKALKNVG